MAVPKASIIQFLLDQQRDSCGMLNNGKVYFYAPGTTDTKDMAVWLDKDATIPANNPYTLNANGTAQLYAYGSFRIVITDSDGIVRQDYDNIYFNSGGDYARTENVLDYLDLADAVYKIGSTRVSLHLDNPTTVLHDLTVPVNIELFRSEGGSITVAPGVTLTIELAPHSPPSRWFYGSGTVVIIGYPQDKSWWEGEEHGVYNQLTVIKGLNVGGTINAGDIIGKTITVNTIICGDFDMPPYGWHYRNQQHIDNLGLNVSMDASKLTIKLTNAAGADLSSKSPVSIMMRPWGDITGAPSIKYATVSSTFSISDPSKLGFAGGEKGRFYVWAIGIGDTTEFQLGVSRSTYGFPETGIYTTATESEVVTKPVISSTTVVTGAIRCIGFIEVNTGPVVNTWVEGSILLVQLMGYGIPRSGDIIQVVPYETPYWMYAAVNPFHVQSTPLWGTTNVGYTFMWHPGITPTSICNILRVEVIANIYQQEMRTWCAGIFRNESGPAISVMTTPSLLQDGKQMPWEITMKSEVVAGSVDKTTFQWNAGAAAVFQAMAINGTSGGHIFGDVYKSSLTVTEIFA